MNIGCRVSVSLTRRRLEIEICLPDYLSHKNGLDCGLPPPTKANSCVGRCLNYVGVRRTMRHRRSLGPRWILLTLSARRFCLSQSELTTLDLLAKNAVGVSARPLLSGIPTATPEPVCAGANNFFMEIPINRSNRIPRIKNPPYHQGDINGGPEGIRTPDLRADNAAA